MGEKRPKKIKGVKIHTLNICMIIVSCIIFAALIYITALLPGKYNQMITASEEYAACEEDAAVLREASDYLTEQIRLFTQNMDRKYLDAYFWEVDQNQRREKALEELERHETTETVRNSLQSALDCSNDLMEQEIYAAKLICIANGYELQTLPQRVRDMPLKAEDTALTSAQMIEKARAMVFDDGYQNAKETIYIHLNYFLTGILETMESRQQESADALGSALGRQRIMITMLFIMNVFMFVAITILIVRPLQIHIQHIRDNHMLDITGSYEFNYLALTYNDIYELNAANKEMLTRKAERDGLTDLMNRTGFDKLCQALRESQLPLALILIAVDRFKGVNDTYGHEMGDSILKKVAVLLETTFRATDYAVRYGGDEFVVIVTDVTVENVEALKRKIAKINDILMHPTDGLVPVSLSAGIAFSEHGMPEDLFKEADQALYYVKEHGRSSCSVYENGTMNDA